MLPIEAALRWGRISEPVNSGSLLCVINVPRVNLKALEDDGGGGVSERG